MEWQCFCSDNRMECRKQQNHGSSDYRYWLGTGNMDEICNRIRDHLEYFVRLGKRSMECGKLSSNGGGQCGCWMAARSMARSSEQYWCFMGNYIRISSKGMGCCNRRI